MSPKTATSFSFVTLSGNPTIKKRENIRTVKSHVMRRIHEENQDARARRRERRKGVRMGYVTKGVCEDVWQVESTGDCEKKVKEGEGVVQEVVLGEQSVDEERATSQSPKQDLGDCESYEAGSPVRRRGEEIC
jgi:hypothetical protein